MWRLVCIVLVCATMVGALMPSRRPAAPSADSELTYTPQSKGTSYRVVDSDGGREDSSTSRSSRGALKLNRESDGHFYVDAWVNGGLVHFLVDTGASGVALSRNDARDAGLALDRGGEQVGDGASGAVMGQWVQLDRLEIGDRTLSGVPAAVIEGGEQSLLGQDVLRGFDIEVHGDEMVLR